MWGTWMGKGSSSQLPTGWARKPSQLSQPSQPIAGLLSILTKSALCVSIFQQVNELLYSRHGTTIHHNIAIVVIGRLSNLPIIISFLVHWHVVVQFLCCLFYYNLTKNIYRALINFMCYRFAVLFSSVLNYDYSTLCHWFSMIAKLII